MSRTKANAGDRDAQQRQLAKLAGKMAKCERGSIRWRRLNEARLKLVQRYGWPEETIRQTMESCGCSREEAVATLNTRFNLPI